MFLQPLRCLPLRQLTLREKCIAGGFLGVAVGLPCVLCAVRTPRTPRAIRPNANINTSVVCRDARAGWGGHSPASGRMHARIRSAVGAHVRVLHRCACARACAPLLTCACAPRMAVALQPGAGPLLSPTRTGSARAEPDRIGPLPDPPRPAEPRRGPEWELWGGAGGVPTPCAAVRPSSRARRRPPTPPPPPAWHVGASLQDQRNPRGGRRLRAAALFDPGCRRPANRPPRRAMAGGRGGRPLHQRRCTKGIVAPKAWGAWSLCGGGEGGGVKGCRPAPPQPFVPHPRSAALAMCLHLPLEPGPARCTPAPFHGRTYCTIGEVMG